MRDAFLLVFLAIALVTALRYPFVGLLSWAWFAIMTPHQMAYGVFGLQLNVLIAAVTLIAIVINGAFKQFTIDRLTALLLMLAGWLWISDIFSLDREYSTQYFDRFLKLIVFVILCIQLTTTKLRFHALLWMLVIGMGYFALKGSLFTIATLGQYRVQGVEHTILEDNNHLGTALVTILPHILYLRAEAARPLVRIGLLGLFVATIISILGTQSRGAFVTLIAFSGFFWLRSRHKFSILAALALVMIPAIAFMPSKWSERMGTITEAGEDASFMGRVDAWVINTKLAMKHPITGAGLRNAYQEEIARTVDIERAARAKAAHSIYFEMLGGSGFVGLGLYLILLGTAILTALMLHWKGRASRAPPWTARFGYFAQMSLFVFCIGGGAVSIEMWDGYLIVVALVAAAARLAKEQQPQDQAWDRLDRPSWRLAARGRSRHPGKIAGVKT